MILGLATVSDDSKKENAQPTFQMTSETTQRSQRQSLIGLLTGELHHQRSSTHEHLQQHLKGNITLKVNVLRDHFSKLYV